MLNCSVQRISNHAKHLMNQICSILILLISASSLAQVTFISSGDSWKYNTGTNLGTAWKDVAYNDSAWLQGPSQLGYGDGDEATAIPSGSSGNFYPTYYFRHSLSISNPSTFQSFILNIKRDDGIVVYINGIEIFRDNMPAGAISYSDWAVTSMGGSDETTWLQAVLSPAAFVNGANVVAAEVHQANATSADVTFDLQLTGGTPPASILSRGPYLQTGTSTGIILRWRTDVKTDSKVRYGTNAGNLNQSAVDLFSTTEHIVQLSGLAADTKYYYSIGSESHILQGDTNNYFITAPVTGTEKITRIWVTGDCGTGQAIQTKVLSAYQNFIGSNYTDLWLLLGDNAYSSGLDNEYQTKFFQPYMNGKIMRQTVLFPTPGNHDYANNSVLLESRATPYFENFTLPKAGEAGGVASGTEMYYSYNHANIHFISLDSYGTENNKKLFDTTSAQIAWLKQDLAANTQKWTIIYWHHPPYTKGSHNSDSENDLVQIRNNVIRLLDNYKVDLVLCGHSHLYERSKIMKGHYGTESTYNPAVHNHSTSSGLYDGSSNSCPYVKSSLNPSNEGIVHVVTGSAGKVSGISSGYPHNAMYHSDISAGGSLYIEVNGNRLDAKWITEDNSILDQFTIMKDVNNSSDITIHEGDSATLSASWTGVYQWSPANSFAKTISVAPAYTTAYYVKDGFYECIHDTFNVSVIPKVTISGLVATEKGVPIPGVMVAITGDASKSMITAADGLYSFEVDANKNYLITPSKNNDVTVANGITTLDIVTIQRQILQVSPLESPFKIIAADVGGNNSVSTLDILLERTMILGMISSFPNGRLWEFVNSDYVFPDAATPFPFEKARTYTNVTSDQMNQNFIGIKLGDVNDSWDEQIP